jgi:hypothetical protein
LRHQRARSEREWLRGRCFFAGNVALRNRALLNAENGFARSAIEDEQIAALGTGGDRGDGEAVAVNVEQNRRRGDIVVPQVVVDGLEMPDALAGIRLERKHAIRKEILSGAIAAVVSNKFILVSRRSTVKTKSVVKHVFTAVSASVVLAAAAMQSAQAAGPTSYQQFWDDVMKTPSPESVQASGERHQEPMTYQESWDSLAKALNDKGYSVLQFDFRGFGLRCIDPCGIRSC